MKIDVSSKPEDRRAGSVTIEARNELVNIFISNIHMADVSLSRDEALKLAAAIIETAKVKENQ